MLQYESCAHLKTAISQAKLLRFTIFFATTRFESLLLDSNPTFRMGFEFGFESEYSFPSPIVAHGTLGLRILGATSRGKRFIDECHVAS